MPTVQKPEPKSETPFVKQYRAPIQCSKCGEPLSILVTANVGPTGTTIDVPLPNGWRMVGKRGAYKCPKEK